MSQNGLIKEKEEQFRQLFKIVERVSFIGKGLRVLHINSDIIEHITYEIIGLLRGALPVDVEIVTYRDDILNFHVSLSGIFKDRFSIILCSETWSRINPGDCIPEIEAIFNQADGKISCEIQEETFKKSITFIQEIKYINYKLRLETLLDVILNPSASSQSVIQTAQSIKADLEKEID